MTLKELVEMYVKLRDKKAELDAAHKQKVAMIEENLTKIEGALLKSFQAAGIDSVKTEAGTAYVSTRNSATVADRESFMTFVKDNDCWFLLDARCNKSGVEQYKAANDNTLPPGVNWRSETVVNVRRS